MTTALVFLIVSLVAGFLSAVGVLFVVADGWDSKWISRTITLAPGPSKSHREQNRTLSITFVGALSLTPILGIVTSCIWALLTTGHPGLGAVALIVLTAGILIGGRYVVSKIQQWREDDYIDFASLQRDLEDAKRAMVRVDDATVERMHRALERRTSQADLDAEWADRAKRGHRWKVVARSKIELDTSIASGIRSQLLPADAFEYLHRYQTASLLWLLVILAASGFAFASAGLAGTRDPWVFITLTGISAGAVALGLAGTVFRARESLALRLCVTARDINQVRSCLLLLRQIRAINPPESPTLELKIRRWTLTLRRPKVSRL